MVPVEEPLPPFLRDLPDDTLDAHYTLSDELECDRQEELSARYQAGMPGVRAVVASPNGHTYVVVDEEVTGSVMRQAEADGLRIVRTSVSAADLRSALQITLEMGKYDYMSVGYMVFEDQIEVFTSRPEVEVRRALEEAGVRSPVSVVIGAPGAIRLSGD